MRLSRRLLELMALVGVAVALPACQSPYEFTLFGYTTAPRHTACVRTVRVPLFKNRTYVRGLEVELTDAVVKRINQITPWRVVQSGDADAELLGTIVAVVKRPILMNELNEVREADLALGVEIEFRTARGDLMILAPQPEAAPPPSPDAPTPPLVLPPGAPRCVFIQRSAPFVPELGQSYATARNKVVKEIAVQIVDVLEDPW